MRINSVDGDVWVFQLSVMASRVGIPSFTCYTVETGTLFERTVREYKFILKDVALSLNHNQLEIRFKVSEVFTG